MLKNKGNIIANNIFILSSIFLLLATGCISKKKHLLALETQAKKEAALLEQETMFRDSKLNRSQQTITQLNLDLAEAQGENNVLLMLRGELQDRIGQLESTVENVNSRSSSTQQNLNQNLQKKDAEISRLQNLVTEVDATLDRHTQLMGAVAGDLRAAISPVLQDQYFIEAGQEEVRLVLLDELIFKSGSVVKVNDLALTVLEKTSEVLQRYPTINLTVVGHTDNEAPSRRANVDNWNVSAQQAATIVRLLTEEYDLSPSQILLGAQGEFKPRTSNATPAGKRENRRVEIIMAPNAEDLVRAVRGVIK